MEKKPVYKRVLLKISGEALSGGQGRGLNFDVIDEVCEAVKTCADMGVQIGIVVGGGNFWRGVKDGGDRMERTRADHMGMLATTMNSLALADAFEKAGVEVRVQTAIEMRAIAEPYIRGRAIHHLERGRQKGALQGFLLGGADEAQRRATHGIDGLHRALLSVPWTGCG